MKQCIAILLLGLLCLSNVSFSDDFTDAALQLNEGSFSAKREAVNAFQVFEDERTLPILQALLDGNLLAHKEQPQLVITSEVNGTELLTDAFTQTQLESNDDSEFEKIRTNNGLRRHIRTAIAGLELSSPDIDKRLRAANNLIKNSDESLAEVLSQALQSEENGKVKERLDVALAIINTQSDDRHVRLLAINSISTAVDPEAVAILNRISALDENGKFIEPDAEIAQAANDALEKINRRLSVYKGFENVFFGISLGSVLLLAAVGLAITFGVMGVINMAHGEMIMLGAYTTFAVQQIFPNTIELSLLIAIPAAFLVSGGTGVLIERLVIRHLYGRPLETLLATFGVSLILQQAVRLYRSNNVPVITPEWMSGSFEINAALSLTYNRFYIIWFSLIVVFALMLLLKKTLFGLQMRAVTQNRPMANAMGIRSSWVDAMTFGLGSGIAGIAGVALSQITNVGPNLGQSYIIDSFMVVVFGGVGNLFGTVFAAMSLGVVNKFLEPVAGAVLGKIFVLVFIILFIQWKPRGMFALKGRAVED